MSEQSNPTDSHKEDGQLKSNMRKVALTALAGTSIEWFDFFLYATAAALVFPAVFFPDSDPTMGLILSFGTFGASFSKTSSEVSRLFKFLLFIPIMFAPYFKAISNSFSLNTSTRGDMEISAHKSKNDLTLFSSSIEIMIRIAEAPFDAPSKI